MSTIHFDLRYLKCAGYFQPKHVNKRIHKSFDTQTIGADSLLKFSMNFNDISYAHVL